MSKNNHGGLHQYGAERCLQRRLANDGIVWPSSWRKQAGKQVNKFIWHSCSYAAAWTDQYMIRKYSDSENVEFAAIVCTETAEVQNLLFGTWACLSWDTVCTSVSDAPRILVFLSGRVQQNFPTRRTCEGTCIYWTGHNHLHPCSGSDWIYAKLRIAAANCPRTAGAAAPLKLCRTLKDSIVNQGE